MPKDLPRPFPAPLRVTAPPDTAPRGAPAPPAHPSPAGEGAAGPVLGGCRQHQAARCPLRGRKVTAQPGGKGGPGGVTGPARPRCAPAHPHPELTALPTLPPGGGSCQPAAPGHGSSSAPAALLLQPGPSAPGGCGTQIGPARGLPLGHRTRGWSPPWGTARLGHPSACPSTRCTRRCPLSRPQGHSPALPSVRFLGSMRLW